jgi:putative toxin-antitoxin system antitoxin component (TIGR02293 family)
MIDAIWLYSVGEFDMAMISVEMLLGVSSTAGKGAKRLSDWIEIIRQGLPASAVEGVARSVKLTQAELSEILCIPERTLIRRKKEGALSAEESAKILRVARMLHRAIEVFDDATAALEWLKAPNASLNDETPISLLDTDLGAEAVLDTLGRIEHGVFA